MFCDACGATMQPGQRFCSNCGKQIIGPLSVAQPRAGRVQARTFVCWLFSGSLSRR